MLKKKSRTRKVSTIPSIIFQKQYIGHARHEGPFLENSYLLYKYLITVLDYKIVEADIVFTSDSIPVLHHGVESTFFKNREAHKLNINKLTYKELRNLSLSKEKFIPITKLENLLELCHQYNTCILLDLTFQTYTFSHLRKLHDLICTHNIKSNTIWGDVNIFKLSLIDRSTICQVGGSWGRKMLIETLFKSFFCKQIIMSFSYYGGDIMSFRQIVRYGHRLGFIMKAATINDEETANKFWQIGVDLINTDSLLNNTHINQ